MKKYNLEKVLPHNHPMILIDDIIDVNLSEHSVTCSVTITKDKIFFEKDGVNPLVGLEFMAQTIGCYSYFKNNEHTPKVGFLLGTRSYKNTLKCFEEGKTYTVKAKEVYGDTDLVSCECFIYNGEEECAHAIVNAYMPADDVNFEGI